MRDLLNLAARYGTRVEMCHIEDANGYYDPDAGRIFIDLSLTPNEVRSVFAHELGHVHYGHTCDAGPNSAEERQARAFAAHLLVHPIDYAEAERVSSDAFFIAEELGVTVNLIDDYRAMCLQRLGERTYGRASRGQLTNELARALS
jgi:Zn-dependent peptidase ImmA (M78 family)